MKKQTPLSFPPFPPKINVIFFFSKGGKTKFEFSTEERIYILELGKKIIKFFFPNIYIAFKHLESQIFFVYFFAREKKKWGEMDQITPLETNRHKYKRNN